MGRTYTLFLALVLATGTCFADTIAVVPGSGGSQNSAWNGNVTIGWQFTLTSSVTVTQLGFFDAGADGLADPHETGIWDSSQTLLGSATVPSGTAGTLLGGFRFVPVTAFLLGPGEYTIGAYGNQTSPDEFAFGLSGSTTIAGLTLGGGVQSGSVLNTLTFPGQVNGFATEGYFGPNFAISDDRELSAVPEPSTIVLVATALGLAGLLRGKRHSA
jgi:hypothetical protein